MGQAPDDRQEITFPGMPGFGRYVESVEAAGGAVTTVANPNPCLKLKETQA